MTITADNNDTGGNTSVLGSLLGQSRHALSAQLYETADQYFHKGVPHSKERAFEDGFFLTICKEVSPEDHAHLHGDEVSEMLPWLWMALRMDPSNVETYRVAAFWLASDLKHPELAYDVLLEAQRNNPGNYQVKLDMARLFLRDGRIDDAGRAFTAAINFWPGKLNREDPEAVNEAIFDKAEILLYRALLHEVKGETESEIELLKEVARIFPDRTEIRERISDLQNGERPVVLATKVLNQMLDKQRDEVHECDEDVHHQENDHE